MATIIGGDLGSDEAELFDALALFSLLSLNVDLGFLDKLRRNLRWSELPYSKSLTSIVSQ
jgi:hypothetical protein